MIAMADDNELELAIELMEAMLEGYATHGADFEAFWYYTTEEAIRAWERRELYIFAGKLIKASNGKPVQIFEDGQLFDNFPQEIIATLD